MGTSPYFNAVVQEDVAGLYERCRDDLEAMRGRRVLIAGANGMLARCMAYAIAYANTQGTEIGLTCLARSVEKARVLYGQFSGEDFFELVSQDVCEEISYEPRVDYIVHAASSASPKFIRTDPVGIVRANTLGTMNLLELARRNVGSRLLLMSTREVYGEVRGRTELAESDMGALDPLDPRSCYPESKRLAETLCSAYRVQHGVDCVAARIAHSYGPGMDIDHDGRVMSDFISDAVRHRDIVLNSDGSAVRAFCYVTDAVAALLAIMVRGSKGEAYNVSNESEPATIGEVATLLSRVPSASGITVTMRPKPNDGTYTSFERVALDDTRLIDLGWAPTVSLAEGMDRTVRSFRTGA